MKKGIIIILAAMFAMCGTSYAQKNVKLGHINSTELMEIMPGKDSAQAVLEKEVAEMEEQMQMMRTELEARYSKYQEKQAEWSELIRQSEQKAITDMNARIEEFAQSAQRTLQQRQEELLKPIIDRAKAAIEAVAKENGYTYIFDAGTGALLYQQDSDDIMPLVKKKLGIN